MSWTVLQSVTGEKPASRFDHAVCVSGDHQVVLCGGRSDPVSKVFADLFFLSYAGAVPLWTRYEKVVPARCGHRICCMGRVLVLFGGRDENLSPTNSLFVMDLNLLEMSRVEATGSCPSPRFDFSMAALDANTIVVFGGLDSNDKQLGDVFLLQSSAEKSLTWIKPEVTGALPSPRSSAVMWARGKCVYVFGGYGELGQTSDLHVLDTETWVWSLVEQRGEVPPATQRYHSVELAAKQICVGEKGPLRLYAVEVQGKSNNVKWESFKTSGALPAMNGFGLSEGGGSLYLMGGKPTKDRDMSVWMLDVAFILGPPTTPDVGERSSRDKVDKHEKAEKHKYGTLRNMFSRKSSSAHDAGAGQKPGLGLSLAGLSTSSAPSSPGQKTRKSGRGNRAEEELGSPSASAVPASPNPGHSRNRSIDSGVRRSTEISEANVGDVRPKSPKTPKSPGLRRADSQGRFGSVNLEDLEAYAAKAGAPRSPVGSPGRNGSSESETTLAHVAELTLRLEKASQELELEKKKSASLREEMDKVTGKGDASVLVRRALDEEVKHTASLKARVETLERDLSNSQGEKQMLLAQASRLKMLITDQSKNAAESEAKIASQAEALKDSQAALLRMEHQLAKTTAIQQKLEQEQVARSLAEMRVRQVEGILGEVMELVKFSVGAQDPILSDVFAQLREAFPELAQESALGIEKVRHDLLLNAGKFAQMVSGKQSSGAGTDLSESSEDISSHEDRGAKPLAAPKSVAMSTETAVTEEVSRHLSLIRELEYRNSLEVPVNYPTPKSQLWDQLSSWLALFKSRIQGKSSVEVLRELCKEEQAYCNDLIKVQRYVLQPLQDQAIISTNAFNGIFGEFPQLIVNAEELASGVRDLTEEQEILEMYSQKLPAALDLYESYSDGIATGLSQLQALRSQSKQFAAFLTGLRNDSAARIFDLTSVLIKPLIHLCIYAEVFKTCADGANSSLSSGPLTPDQSQNDAGVSTEVDTETSVATATMPLNPAETLSKMVMIPAEMVQEKLVVGFSASKLRYVESMLVSGAEDAADVVGPSGRVVLDDAEFVVVMQGEERRVEHLYAILCSDLLFLLRTQKLGSVMLLHDLIPLSLLQVQTAVDSSSFSFCSKANSGRVYVAYAGTSAMAKQWEDLLKLAALAAFTFYQERAQFKEGSISASTSSGWFAGTSSLENVAAAPPRELVDGDDICYAKDATTGRVTVRGGKPEELIKWLIHDISGPSATEEVLQFLQACNGSISGKQILEVAITEFKACSSVAEQIKVLNFVGLWAMEFAVRDVFGGAPEKRAELKTILNFIEKVSRKKEYGMLTNPIKLGLIRGSNEAKSRSGLAVDLSALDTSAINLEDMQPVVFAEQLTVYVHSLLNALSDEDLYQGDKSPNVFAMIKFWNDLSDWTVAFLTQSPDESFMIMRLRKMLSIAKCCLDLKNFDSAFALTLALDVARIPKSVIEGAGRGASDVIESLNFVTNVSRGFANYRALTESLEPPAIPYLAIALKDIVLIRENDTFIGNTQLLNYRKIVILGSRYRFFRRYKRVKFDISPIPIFQAGFKKLSESTQALKQKPPEEFSMPKLNLVAALSPGDSRTFSGKIQALKKTVLTGSSSLSFFTPRDSSSSSQSPQTVRDRDSTREKVEARRPFTARPRGKAEEVKSESIYLAASPEPQRLNRSAGPTSPKGGNQSPSLSHSSTASTPGTNTSPRAEDASPDLGRSGEIGGVGGGTLRWSRALPRSSGGNALGGVVGSSRSKSGTLRGEVNESPREEVTESDTTTEPGHLTARQEVHSNSPLSTVPETEEEEEEDGGGSCTYSSDTEDQQKQK